MFKMASQNQYSDFNSTDLTRLFEEQKYQDIISGLILITFHHQVILVKHLL